MLFLEKSCTTLEEIYEKTSHATWTNRRVKNKIPSDRWTKNTIHRVYNSVDGGKDCFVDSYGFQDSRKMGQAHKGGRDNWSLLL